jgi:2'-5' RNA ligase
MRRPRYAIYLAPPPCTPLWQFGSKVLGHDAVSGLDVHGFAPDGMDAPTWRRMTMRPRAYGFHATLKAPFRLAEGCDRDGLVRALSDFAAARDAFDLGPLAITSIADQGGYGFVALTQTLSSAELATLEIDTVRGFDHFRAPLDAEERAKRKPERLTTRQKQSLEQYGYPHVGPDYRFHMTLSGDIADVYDIADKLADAMANDIGTASLRVDALVLFEQPSPDQNFRVIQRAELKAPQGLR